MALFERIPIDPYWPVEIRNDVYFYVNKDVWCDKYKNFIKEKLYEIPVFLILDTFDGVKVAAFACVADFEENFGLIEKELKL